MYEYLLLEYAYFIYSPVFLDLVMPTLACRGNLSHQSTCKNTGFAILCRCIFSANAGG